MNGRNPKIDALQKEIDLEIKRIREKTKEILKCKCGKYIRNRITK